MGYRKTESFAKKFGRHSVCDKGTQASHQGLMLKVFKLCRNKTRVFQGRTLARM